MTDAYEMAKQLERTEELLVSRLSSNAVQRILSEEYGVEQRTARGWIRKVRDQWNEEAGQEDRVERRNHMRASVNDLFVRALTRKVPLSRGREVVYNEDGEPRMLEEPDLKTAIRAAETLCRLDGLYDVKGAAQDVIGELGVELAAIVIAKRSREAAANE